MRVCACVVSVAAWGGGGLSLSGHQWRWHQVNELFCCSSSSVTVTDVSTRVGGGLAVSGWDYKGDTCAKMSFSLVAL